MTTVPPVPSPRPAEEIQALCDAATPGPWELQPSGVILGPPRNREALAAWVVQLVDLIHPEDAAFIAAARSAVPTLLADRERLSAELADARATVERVSAAWADVIQRQQRADNEHRYDVEEITGRAVAAERALEAVRALPGEIVRAIDKEWLTCQQTLGRDAEHEARLGGAMSGLSKARLIVQSAFRAALSAASPTTSDDEERARPRLHPEAVRQHERATVALDGSAGPSAASDEPARCDHSRTEAHYHFENWTGRQRRCPGPAASGTPETTR